MNLRADAVMPAGLHRSALTLGEQKKTTGPLGLSIAHIRRTDRLDYGPSMIFRPINVNRPRSECLLAHSQDVLLDLPSASKSDSLVRRPL